MNKRKTKILSCLQQIKGSGKFASIRTADFVFPGLEVKNHGEIAFPFNGHQAEALIKLAKKASFGKSSETIMDTNVRSTWEFDANKLSFNDSWSGFLEETLEKLKIDLGLEDYIISAHCYKLLIYQKGDFFLPHKDTEKEKGMFGTLIVGLPSKYTGGELEICFDGIKEIADFSKNSYTLNCAAFYADCEHQVKPLTSGYRVCLVYNLVQQKPGKKIEPKSIQTHVNRLSELLKEESPSYKADIVLLGHQYTPENFSAENLKLNDRARAEALLLAAQQNGYYAKMCLVTSYITGIPEYDGYYDAPSTAMGEVIDQSINIEHWLKSDVPTLNVGSLDEDELLATFSTTDTDPLEEESTGYMGNYGPDIMHWYHYGAIMIWSPKVNAALLPSQNAATQLNWVSYFVEQSSISNDELSAVQDLLINGLNEDLWSRDQQNFNAVVQWLIWRKDETFMLRLSLDRLQFFLEKIDTKYWILLLEFMSTENTAKWCEKIVKNITVEILEKYLMVLSQMRNSESLKSIALEEIKALPVYFDKLYREGDKRIHAEALSCIFDLAMEHKDKEWINQMAAVLFINPQRDYLRNAIAPILLKERGSFEFLDLIRDQTISYLKKRVADKPQPPKDWIREIPVTILPIPQWEILRPFMESPEEVVFDFRKKKVEREAMEEVINSAKVDLVMKTITTGSPHTLRIMKTQASYERNLKKWRKDLSLLKRLG